MDSVLTTLSDLCAQLPSPPHMSVVLISRITVKKLSQSSKFLVRDRHLTKPVLINRCSLGVKYLQKKQGHK